ncbi:zinc finger, CCCH-type [Artemisia annua]|uniref:Zinc finger, CCCH-type n=1 Tax=Artemisia annua TaxID=35608 RepID=A0A2U1L3W5_ARTAN|nr:zinc finger, CCCH-type [Artemisia annua]
MIQHPFNGGNNNSGQGEFIPHLNGSNSQIDNSNRRVNSVTQNSTRLSSAGQRPNRSSVPMSRGTTHIFYKTRLCQQFVDGTCPKAADGCNYAHGPSDLRAPPLNWNEDRGRIGKRGICWKFSSGEECPYGDNCSYIHDATMFNVGGAMDSGRERESSGQSQTVGRAVQVRTASSDQNVLRTSVKGTYWKTKTCNQWETTGHCVFADKCNYAHGLAAAAAPPVQQGKWFEKLAGKLAGGKLKRIYADWIDDEDYELSKAFLDVLCHYCSESARKHPHCLKGDNYFLDLLPIFPSPSYLVILEENTCPIGLDKLQYSVF